MDVNVRFHDIRAFEVPLVPLSCPQLAFLVPLLQHLSCTAPVTQHVS